MKTSMKTYNSLSSPMKKRMNNNRKLINTFGPVRASLGLRAVSYIRVGERKVKEEKCLPHREEVSFLKPSRTESNLIDMIVSSYFKR
jgi:hypothetical protein